MKDAITRERDGWTVDVWPLRRDKGAKEIYGWTWAASNGHTTLSAKIGAAQPSAEQALEVAIAVVADTVKARDRFIPAGSRKAQQATDSRSSGLKHPTGRDELIL